MRKSIWIILASLLCLFFIQPAVAQTESTELADGQPVAAQTGCLEDGVLRVGSSDPISTMDVHLTSEEYMIPLNIYERLFDIRVDEDGLDLLDPGLAEDYTVSEDGLTYSFTLREDAYFSDGTPVKASDVAFTFSRMLSHPGSKQTDFADMILGAQDVIMKKRDQPEGIRVLDDRHLDITLSEPFSGYVYLLASPPCSILSEAFVKKVGDEYGSDEETTLGSGPYMVTAYSKEQVILEKNPYYHCHKGEKLSASSVWLTTLPPAVMYSSFQNGDLDILDTNLINPDAVDEIIDSGKWLKRLVVCDRVEIRYLMMNMDTPPLDDVRIRKAVQLAIDRQKILDELYGGAGILIDGIFPKGLIGYCKENQGWLKYDPEEAKRLISEVPGAREARLELAANSQTDSRKLTMLQMICDDLREVGLNVSIVSYDSESYTYLRHSGDLISYTGEWSADYNDPDNFIYTFFGNRGKTLYRSSNFADEEILSRIRKARTIKDWEERMDEYAALERILVREDAVWVPLISTEHLFVLGSRVRSFQPFWAGWSSMYFRDVEMKE